MKLDKYSRRARIYPTIIGLLPIYIFINFTDSKYLELLRSALEIQILSNISLTIVLVYFLSQTCRGISKKIESIVYEKEKKFPTTNFLLWSDDSLSHDYKSKLHEKIFDDFNLELLKKNQEDEDLKSAKKLISDSVGLIRNKVGDGNLLLQHNIEYGFYRNLIGASFIGLIFSIIFILVSLSFINDKITIYSYIGLGFFYFLYILFSKSIINHFGELYAKRLFIEYL